MTQRYIFKSSVLHDPSEIILICDLLLKKRLLLLLVLLLSMFKTAVLLHIFCVNDDNFFSGFFDELKVLKNSIYFKLIF